MEKASLTLIILNYNTPEWMEKCLSNIHHYALTGKTIKIVNINVIMVDNGSSDNSVQIISQKFPWVKIITSARNLGFAGGNNLALRQVKTDYVMLLNSDTEFTPETHLEEMIDYMEAHLDVAVMTPKLLLGDGQLDMASHRGEPTPWASFTYFSKLAAVFPHSKIFAQYHQTYQDFSQVHPIDACSGAAMLIRTSAMKKVGLIDERFFMYAEDLDWCKRFRDHGYGVVYFPKAVIIHHKYKSGRKNKDRQVAKQINSYFYDTMLQYYDKHYRTKYPEVVRQFISLFIIFKKGAK